MNHRTRIHESACLPSGSLGVIFAFAVALSSDAAFAGDMLAPSAPPTPDQARCNAIGEGFYAVKGSNACIKISGYVAAGADFVAPGAKGSGASAPRPTGGLDSQTAVSAEVRLDTPLGPGRLYVQIGHDATTTPLRPLASGAPARLDFAGSYRQFRAPSGVGRAHMRAYLSFETPVAEIDARVDELRALVAKGDLPALAEELAKLEAKSAKTLADLYAALTPWQKTQVARVQGRPHFADYVKGLIEDFTPLAGDRKFGEDAAIVGGLGRFRGEPICLIGHEKGEDTTSRLKHNFGMARPEGYRKAARLMELADRFDLPVISLVDTAGAWPGIDAEERGQAEAIARATDASLSLGSPNVAVIVGEGGSGGRAGDRGLQQGLDARTCDLHGRFARSRRLDPLARFLARAGRGDEHEDHRAGPDQIRHHRFDRAGAGRRRPSRPRGGGGRDGPRDRRGARFARETCRARNCARRAPPSSSRSGARYRA